MTPLLYPRLIALHKLLLAAPGAVAELRGALPDGLVASSESLEQGGVYLLENGRDALLFFTKDAPPGLVQVGVGLGVERGRLVGGGWRVRVVC